MEVRAPIFHELSNQHTAVLLAGITSVSARKSFCATLLINNQFQRCRIDHLSMHQQWDEGDCHVNTRFLFRSPHRFLWDSFRFSLTQTKLNLFLPPVSFLPALRLGPPAVPCIYNMNTLHHLNADSFKGFWNTHKCSFLYVHCVMVMVQTNEISAQSIPDQIILFHLTNIAKVWRIQSYKDVEKCHAFFFK